MYRSDESIDYLLYEGPLFYGPLKGVVKYLERINKIDLTKDYEKEASNYKGNNRPKRCFEAAVMDGIKSDIIHNENFYDSLRRDLQKIEDMLKKIDFYENLFFIERRKFIEKLKELE